MAVTQLPNTNQPDQLLWRYMKLSTLLMLLESSEAFFPSIETLRSTDRLEGTIHAPGPIMTEKHLPSSLNEFVEWISPELDKFEHSHVNHPDPTARSHAITEIYVRELTKRRAVWCWFAFERESASMWSAYGNNGVAIGSTIGALSNALPFGKDFQIASIKYPQQYQSHESWLSTKIGDDWIRRPHLVKTKEYADEREIRVVTKCDPKSKGSRVKGINWKTLIDTIIVSPTVPHGEFMAIAAIIKKFDWGSDCPEIHRSSMLGAIAEDDEELEYFSNYSDFLTPELGLPNLIGDL